MRFIVISICLCLSIFAQEANKMPSKQMSVSEKKKIFYTLLIPAVHKAYSELMKEYRVVRNDIKYGSNPQKIEKLKKYYNVTTDEELLAALKPHPKSIALAQAAIESGWGTSRFFKEANNIFGMWSVSKNEDRIAASQQRAGNKTIWLRKFDSIEDSVKEYYKLMAKGRAYKEFRDVRSKTDNVYEIVKKLDKYSETGEEYVEKLSDVIKHNDLTKFDTSK